MKDNDDDIQFVEMPDWGGITLGSNDKSKEKLKAKPQLQPEKEYASLYEELEDKCNPKNFMEPFVLERFNTASEIYGQMRAANDKSDDSLIYLRNRCINELGISFSTKRIYDRLFSIINPENYIKEEVFDAEKVKRAGELYDKLIKKQHDIRALEQFEVEVLGFIKEYDYKNRSNNNGPDKEPDVPSDTEINEANKQLEYDYEEHYFKNYSARDYLDKYPNGIYSEEAKYYWNHTMEEYMIKYPQGRYVYKVKPADDDDNSDSVIVAVAVVAFIVAIVIVCVLNY